MGGDLGHEWGVRLGGNHLWLQRHGLSVRTHELWLNPQWLRLLDRHRLGPRCARRLRLRARKPPLGTHRRRIHSHRLTPCTHRLRIHAHWFGLDRLGLRLGQHGLVLAVGLLAEAGSGDGIATLAGVFETEQAESDTGETSPQPPAHALSVEVVTEQHEHHERDRPQDCADGDSANAVDVDRTHGWRSQTVSTTPWHGHEASRRTASTAGEDQVRTDLAISTGVLTPVDRPSWLGSFWP